MKIVRVFLKNLNSLKGEHIIDLEKEPFVSAGIFAITGHTGSGKSTILDAITLALYGRAARYGSAPNPDDVMSRHTGECHAEVVFDVSKGRYRAVWQLRRAGNRSSGKLQAAKRYVYDAQDNVIAQSIKEADEVIEGLTGLDANHFFRSVLLAQGDFAKFLKAKSEERASLLESLTGTNIYTVLSLAAHEMTSEKEKKVQQGEESMRQIVLLAEDIREAKQKEGVELFKKIKIKEKEEKKLTEDINRGDQLGTLRNKLNKLYQDREKLSEERLAVSTKLKQLDSHKKTDPFLREMLELDQKIKEQGEKIAQWELEVARLTQTKRCFRAGYNTVSSLITRLILEEEETHEELQDQKLDMDTKLADLNKWFKTNEQDQFLDSTMTAIVEQLTSLNDKRVQEQNINKSQNDLQSQAAEANSLLNGLEIDQTCAKEELKKKQNFLKEADKLIKDLTAARTIDQIQEELNQKKILCDGYLKIQEKLILQNSAASEAQQIEKDLTELESNNRKALNEKKEVNELLVLEKTKFDNLQKELFKKSLIVELHEHRETLKHGESCPLCGSLEHPFAGNSSESESKLSQQDKSLQKMKVSLEKIEIQLTDSSSLYDTSKEALRIKIQEQSGVNKKLKLAIAEFKKVAKEFDFSPSQVCDLENEINTTKKAVSSIEDLLRNIDQAEKKLVTDNTAVLTQQNDVERINGQFLAQQNSVKSLKKQLDTGKKGLESLNVEIIKLNVGLNTLLQPFNIEIPSGGEEKNLQKSLEERRQVYATNTKKQQNLQEDLSKLREKITNTQTRCNDLRQEATKLSESYDVTNFQSDLLFEKKYAQKWLSFSDAKEGLKELSTTFLLRKDVAEDSHQSLQKLKDEIKELEKKLNKRLTNTEFKDVNGLRLARLKEGEILEIEDIDLKLRERAEQLVGEKKGIDSDIQKLINEEAPEEDLLLNIKEQKENLSQQLIKDRSQLTLLNDELKRDNQAREIYDEKVKVIEEDRKQYATWRQLWELIGSHDGKKFRIFAQGLSLELLIQRANKHLAKLNGRYCLHRIPDEQLDLEIQDLHQASITRPTVSLSGGESFLVSLSLALGLSELAGRNIRIDSLFIDEGFGSLDSETLDIAISALESLRANNKCIGVISHLELLKERITTQIHVEKIGCGVSKINFPENYKEKLIYNSAFSTV